MRVLSLELDYYRRPGEQRRLRRALTWAALPLSAVLLAFLSTSLKTWPTFQPGPLSSAHVMFNEQCESCHDVPFGPVRRFLSGNQSSGSISDVACLKCHDVAEHQAGQVGTIHCIACHHEHRGQDALTRVDDSRCTSCHADLMAHTNLSRPLQADQGVRDRKRMFRDVSHFISGNGPDPPAARPHPQFALPERDPSAIRFPHSMHISKESASGSLEREALRCSVCHREAETGRTMSPIRYDRHCRECHPLDVQVFGAWDHSSAVKAGAERFRAIPARHPVPGEDAAAVRTDLHGRYFEFARAFPEVYSRPARPGQEDTGSSPSRRDTKSGVTNALDWVESQVVEACRLLFEGSEGCRKCHREIPPSDGSSADLRDRLPAYLPPRISERWLNHGVFSHHSHRSLSCLECHAGAPTSRNARDVLIPQLETCQKCHNGQSSGARIDCLECHVYHQPGKAPRSEHFLRIDEFLHGRSGATPLSKRKQAD